jgi:hypothetical protein
MEDEMITLKERKPGRPRNDMRLRAYEKITMGVKAPSKRVYICSPFKGNVARNVKNAKIYCRFAYEQGYVPIAPHLFYPLFLDDTDKQERAAGIRYGLESLWQASELWIFGQYISEGMRAEIELAEDLEIPIKHFDEYMVEL